MHQEGQGFDVEVCLTILYLAAEREGRFMSEVKNNLSYASAGVNIDAGNVLVDKIKPHAQRTNRTGVIA